VLLKGAFFVPARGERVRRSGGTKKAQARSAGTSSFLQVPPPGIMEPPARARNNPSLPSLPVVPKATPVKEINTGRTNLQQVLRSPKSKFRLSNLPFTIYLQRLHFYLQCKLPALKYIKVFLLHQL
jgi:hypothetical protein